MKFCSKCGKEIMDDAVVCPGCGCSQAVEKKEADASSFGWAFLGFCIPLLGLILYLVWRNDTPLKAKSVGKGALVSVIVSVVISIIYGAIIGAAIGSGAF